MGKRRINGKHPQGSIKYAKDERERIKYIINKVKKIGFEKGYDELTILNITEYILQQVEMYEIWDKAKISDIIRRDVAANLAESIHFDEKREDEKLEDPDEVTVGFYDSTLKKITIYRKKPKERIRSFASNKIIRRLKSRLEKIEERKREKKERLIIFHELFHTEVAQRREVDRRRFNNMDDRFNIVADCAEEVIQEGEACYVESKKGKNPNKSRLNFSPKYEIYFYVVRQLIAIVGSEQEYFSYRKMDTLTKIDKILGKTNYSLSNIDLLYCIATMNVLHSNSEISGDKEKDIRLLKENERLRGELQDRLTRLFIGKRCKDLKIKHYDESYFRSLTLEQLRQELSVWTDFDQSSVGKIELDITARIKSELMRKELLSLSKGEVLGVGPRTKQ